MGFGQISHNSRANTGRWFIKPSSKGGIQKITSCQTMGYIITGPPNKIKRRAAPCRHGLDVVDDKALLSTNLFVSANKSDCRARV